MYVYMYILYVYYVYVKYAKIFEHVRKDTNICGKERGDTYAKIYTHMREICENMRTCAKIYKHMRKTTVKISRLQASGLQASGGIWEAGWPTVGPRD